jgi:uncharacterized DUF497 family protein
LRSFNSGWTGLVALTFEWDEVKSKRNLEKHGVPFEEAKTVFNDPFSITVSDPDHSNDEDRFLDTGISSKGRVLVVWYTERKDRIRIIGCRVADPSERKEYEKGYKER